MIDYQWPDQELVARFGTIPTAKVAADIPQLLRVYARVNLAANLRRLASDGKMLTAIAADSYLHGNGFYKIVLRSWSGCKLRLHVWMRGVNAEENVHEHRWAFASTVVTGALHSELYSEDVSCNSAEFEEYLYVAKSGDTPPSKLYVGKTRLTVIESVVQSAGDSYHMLPGVLHRIVRTNHSLTATLVLQCPAARGFNRLLLNPGKSAKVETQPLCPAHVAAVINELLTDLAQQTTDSRTASELF